MQRVLAGNDSDDLPTTCVVGIKSKWRRKQKKNRFFLAELLHFLLEMQSFFSMRTGASDTRRSKDGKEIEKSKFWHSYFVNTQSKQILRNGNSGFGHQ